ncbi:amino-acid N-acetyltransferase [Niveibacterium umoris]|uniref:Amino-acid acetyltransferase n=2 Tax=Niveibacterium umoris TaxID=1193620 RepID=A0A840BT13_9RHOO|nr:amino-acid N-acetyltransferase [Niveibacterium umoris]
MQQPQSDYQTDPDNRIISDKVSAASMMPDADAIRFVEWVRSAAPYVHAFRGKTFVLGFGGEVAEGDLLEKLCYDCNLLAAMGVRLVLVHGTRPQIEEELARRKLPSRLHKGVRVTDGDALECVKAAVGTTRIEVEARLSQGLPNTPMAGAHMRVTGGNFITAKPLGVVDGIDFQYTGAVRKVIADEISADLDQQNVVLISPLGVSPSGEIFNLAMEEVAEQVAIALGAEKLIYLCDAPGLLDEQGRLIETITADEAERMFRADRGLTEDLHLFLPRAIRAVRSGVNRAHLLDRDKDGGLLLEFFTRQGVGTMVSKESLARFREATIEDVGALLSIITPLEADGTLVRRSRELIEMEITQFSLVEHDGVTVGCAALYPFSEERAAEMACLAVTPQFRRSGLGERLMQHIETRARAAGLERLFVLTTRTEHWFRERGFREVSPDELPQEKRELYNFQRRSKVLMKEL